MNLRNVMVPTLLLVASGTAEIARAELQTVKINGKVLTAEAPAVSPLVSPLAAPAPAPAPAEEPSAQFSADEGWSIARTARVAKAQHNRHQMESATENCFRLMREAATAGECTRTFWAEDSACAEEQTNGCFENKRFLRKLDSLGFEVTKKTSYDDNEGECNSLTARWCNVTKDHGKEAAKQM